MAPLFATCRHRPCASFAMALSGDCVTPRNYRSAGIKCREMIRVVHTDEAYGAIASTLPKGTRYGGPCSAIGTDASSNWRRR